MNNALKFISETPDTYRVANYIVLFGGRDLDGEHFTAKTELESKYTKTGVLEVDWEHGREFDGDIGPSRTDVLGFVDWRTAKSDERGVWVERVLNRSMRYVEWIKQLIEEGIIGNSTEAINDDVEKAEDGFIKRWPLRRDSLTVQPAEPRMITENALQALKALSSEFPELAKLIPKAEEATSEDGESEISNKEKTMDEKEVKDEAHEEEVEEVVEEETIDLEAILEAQKSSILDETKELVADAGKTAAEEVIKAIQAEPEEKAEKFVLPKNVKINPRYGTGDPDKDLDFRRWVVSGEAKVKGHKSVVDYPYHTFDKNPDGSYFMKQHTVKAALQEGTDGEGGYLVPVGELGRIIAKRDEASLAGPLGCQIFTTDSDTFNVPTEGTSMTAFTIVTEEGAITAAQNEPTFAQVQLTPFNYKKLIKVSDELDEDENSGLSGFLSEALGRAWSITENAFIQTGTGSSQPQGATVGGTAGLTLDSASAIGAAEVPELIGKMQRAYRDNAVLLVRRATEAYLLQLFGTSGFSFVQAPVGGMFRGRESALSAMTGYPVWATEDMAAIAASAITMLFGNFNFYGIVRNRSLRVRRLVELYAGNGQIGILANMRTDGAVLQAEAFQYASHPSA